MDSGLKQRLVGAVVLVALAVIFLPMLLDGSGARERLNEDIAIPERPEAPESRLQHDGSGSPSGGMDDGDAATATLATDDFSGAADTGADTAEQVDSGPERETEAQASADAPEEESGSDRGSTAVDATDNRDADPAPSEGWIVQVGSFRRETNAIVLRDRLREEDFDANVEQVTGDNGTLWRVWLGPVGEREAGEALERRIEDHRGSDALLMEYSE